MWLVMHPTPPAGGAATAGGDRLIRRVDGSERICPTDYDRLDADHEGAVEPPAGASAEEQAVRRWLEDAWRHGELVDVSDGVCAEATERPVDRFRTASGSRR
jgi:hypothetical protein